MTFLNETDIAMAVAVMVLLGPVTAPVHAQKMSSCGAEFVKKRTAYFNNQERKRKKACDKLIDDRDYVRCVQKYSFE